MCLIPRYWIAAGRLWIFAVKKKYRGKDRVYQLLRLSSIGIKRHIKIRAAANPYAPEYSGYFWNRRHNKEVRLMKDLSARGMRLATA